MAEPLTITRQQTIEVFGDADPAVPEVMLGDRFTTEHGVQIQFVGTTLGVEQVDEDSYRITANTVPRLCPAAENCAATRCGLGEVAMGNRARRELDCAAANTEPAFEGRPGYVLTPLSPDVIFLGDEGSTTPVTAKDQYGKNTPFFEKIKTGSVLIISEHDLEDPEKGVAVAVNVADSVVASKSLVGPVTGTRYAAVLYSERRNLGDRGPDERLGAKTVEAILDREGLQGAEREAAKRDMTVQIDVGYSASLRNFAHEVRVPEIVLPEGVTPAQALEIMAQEDRDQVPQDQCNPHIKQSRYALQLADGNGLIDPESGELTNEVTPTMVMADQYPGALENGEIYGQYEGEHNMEDAPRGPGGCPGHGERCHIHYPKITRRTRVGELVAAGIPEENVRYDNSRAIDPASQDNRLASNRRSQLAGVPASKTLRTASSVIISFPPREALATAV